MPPRTGRRGASLLWRRTPLVLLRFPGVFWAVVASATLLVIAAITGSLFLATTGASALNSAIADVNRFTAGLFVSQTGNFYKAGSSSAGDLETLTTRNRLLRRATGSMDHLGNRVVTVYGEPITVGRAGEDSSTSASVRLLARTGATAHVTRLASDGGEGVWLADTTAASLNVEVGDDVLLGGDTGQRTTVRLAGIFRALVNEPLKPYWSPLYPVIFPRRPVDPAPPPFALADRDVVIGLSRRLGLSTATFQWDFPIALRTPLTLPAARKLNQQFEDLRFTLGDPSSPLSHLFSCLNCNQFRRSESGSSLNRALAKANDTIGGLKAPVDVLSIAGAIVALVVVAAAGAYGLHRRRAEAMFLSARGMAPAVIGLKAGVESFLPIVAGTVLGYGCARVLAGWLGARGAPIALEEMASATLTAAASVPLAATVLGFSAAVSSTREAQISEPARRSIKIPWEVAGLVAAAALYRVFSGKATLVEAGSDDVPRVNHVLLLFPVLLIAAGSGIIARGFKSAMRSICERSERFTAALYLGVHRLAGAPRLATVLVTASGLALGLFVYAQTMVKSLEVTTRAKAHLFTGGDAKVLVDRVYELPDDFSLEASKVSQIVDRATVLPEERGVSVLAVDADELPSVAFWDEGLGRGSLRQLMREITSVEGGLGALAVGDLPDDTVLEISGAAIPVRITAHVSAFPGTFPGHPWLIVDGYELANAAGQAGGPDPRSGGVLTWLWIKGDPSSIHSALAELGFTSDEIISADEVLERPAFVSVSRTFRFLRALAILAVTVVLIGMVLYLQARQRARVISYALARRMGLRARSHLTAVAFELGAMLSVAALGGLVLGVTAALLLYSRIDPLPRLAPDPFLRIPLTLPLPLIASIAAVTFAGAYLAHRAAERANVADALRRPA